MADRRPADQRFLDGLSDREWKLSDELTSCVMLDDHFFPPYSVRDWKLARRFARIVRGIELGPVCGFFNHAEGCRHRISHW